MKLTLEALCRTYLAYVELQKLGQNVEAELRWAKEDLLNFKN